MAVKYFVLRSPLPPDPRSGNDTMAICEFARTLADCSWVTREHGYWGTFSKARDVRSGLLIEKTGQVLSPASSSCIPLRTHIKQLVPAGWKVLTMPS